MNLFLIIIIIMLSTDAFTSDACNLMSINAYMSVMLSTDACNLIKST